jgi:hypothetical protein
MIYGSFFVFIGCEKRKYKIYRNNYISDKMSLNRLDSLFGKSIHE